MKKAGDLNERQKTQSVLACYIYVLYRAFKPLFVLVIPESQFVKCCINEKHFPCEFVKLRFHKPIAKNKRFTCMP